MSLGWEDLVARARGLATHLLGPERLADVARARDLADLERRLVAAGIPVSQVHGGASVEAMELALRRLAGQRLQVLARWCGPRTASLRIIFEDEDRRSLRALLRGLVSAVAPESRLAGLIPTPALPIRALEQLARLHSPGEFAALLVVWGNPYGSALMGPVARPEPELLAAELALARRWATRVREGAQHGDRTLRQFVAERIDIENLLSALLLAGSGFEQNPEECFLRGGTRVGLELFQKGAAARDSSAGSEILVQGLDPGPLARQLRAHHADPVAFEAAILPYQIGWLQRHRRLDPLSSAPVLEYALQVRQELNDLQGVIWGIGLGAPPDLFAASGAP